MMDTKTFDLRYARLCEPDGTVVDKDAPVPPVMDGRILIPFRAYGRRVRVIRMDALGARVARERLDAYTVRRAVGIDIRTNSWTAESGQRCMCIKGTAGGLIMGEGFTSLTRRTIRGMEVSLLMNGFPDVRL